MKTVDDLVFAGAADDLDIEVRVRPRAPGEVRPPRPKDGFYDGKQPDGTWRGAGALMMPAKRIAPYGRAALGRLVHRVRDGHVCWGWPAPSIHVRFVCGQTAFRVELLLERPDLPAIPPGRVQRMGVTACRALGLCWRCFPERWELAK